MAAFCPAAFSGLSTQAWHRCRSLPAGRRDDLPAVIADVALLALDYLVRVCVAAVVCL